MKKYYIPSYIYEPMLYLCFLIGVSGFWIDTHRLVPLFGILLIVASILIVFMRYSYRKREAIENEKMRKRKLIQASNKFNDVIWYK